MAPTPSGSILQHARSVNINNPSTTADYFAAQWVNPGDIFSILLLLGPEVIQQAVAQLAGRQITPVAFSFGWVAYAVRALLSAVGGNPSVSRPKTEKKRFNEFIAYFYLQMEN